MSQQKAVAVFGSSATEPGSKDWVDAERAGTRLAAAGLDVVTGGYGGTMEAVSRGAAARGSGVIGVTATALFPSRSGANRHVTLEIETETLAQRIGALIDMAHGTLVLPGSIGTAAELMVAWNFNHIARLAGGTRKPTSAVGEDWAELAELLVRRTGANVGDVHLSASVDDAVDWLLGQEEMS